MTGFVYMKMKCHIIKLFICHAGFVKQHQCNETVTQHEIFYTTVTYVTFFHDSIINSWLSK